MFHKHNFVLIDKTILPSAWEQLNSERHVTKVSNSNYVMFQKKVIIILKCEICGTIKEIVETNP